MSPTQYAEEIAYQRDLGRAQVHTMIMQLHLDLHYQGPTAPRVRLVEHRLRNDRVAVWRIECPDLPLWDAADLVRPLVEEFDL